MHPDKRHVLTYSFTLGEIYLNQPPGMFFERLDETRESNRNLYGSRKEILHRNLSSGRTGFLFVENFQTRNRLTSASWSLARDGYGRDEAVEFTSRGE